MGDIFLLTLCASFVMAVLIVVTQRFHLQHTADSTNGIQKLHNGVVPRIGGVAILLGMLVVLVDAQRTHSELLQKLLLAGAPAFVAGLIEDLTKRVSVRMRLLATMFSGLLAYGLTGISLTHLDVWGLDMALGWWPFSLVFTVFAVAGVANAFNIVDGCHGLASGLSLMSLATLGFISHTVGDAELAFTCAVVFASVLGFLLVNYPWGKIFLGDGGAYLVGFIIGWIAVMLPMRNSSVSPWASLLACAYPIIEVVFSIIRRRARKHHPSHPDRLHMHSLIYRRFTYFKIKREYAKLRNSAVAPIVLLINAPFCLIAINVYETSLVLISCAAIFFITYRLIYSSFLLKTNNLM